jgi:hypothetical protein
MRAASHWHLANYLLIAFWAVIAILLIVLIVRLAARLAEPLAKLALLERMFGNAWFDTYLQGRRLGTAAGKQCVFGPESTMHRPYCIGNRCMGWRWYESPSPLHWRRWLWQNRGYCAATLREGAISLARPKK